MKSPIRLCLSVLTLFSLILGLAGTPSPARAATLVVTNTNDSGPGSLRAAIIGAGTGDTITFDSSLSGATIYLQSTLTIGAELTIDGSGLAYPITVSGDSDNDGNGDVRGFAISNGAVTLKGFIISHAYAGTNGSGGGIFVNSSLNLNEMVLEYNQAGMGGSAVAVYSGILNIENSRFVANGSGEEMFGDGIDVVFSTATINNSTFEKHPGRAIVNDSGSDLLVMNSTFVDNDAGNVWGGGGAIHNNGNTVTVRNSTFYNNRASWGTGGAIYNGGTALTVQNSTFSYNEGAIRSDGILHLSNSILANSFYSDYPGYSNDDCVIYSGGTILTYQNNLIESQYGCGAPTLSADPLLGPLEDNGGPTHTMRLLPGSPAIDAGDDGTCPGLDQRGVARPQRAHCDMGAYEAPIEVTNANPSGTGSLAAAVAEANAQGGTIHLLPQISGQTITLQASLPIEQAVEINGENLTEPLNISTDTNKDGLNDLIAFDILSGGALILRNAELDGKGGTQEEVGPAARSLSPLPASQIPVLRVALGGQAELRGVRLRGTIKNQGSLSLRHSEINAKGGTQEEGAFRQALAEQTLEAYTGGVYNTGSLVIANSLLNGFQAELGGAIYNEGTLLLVNSALNQNTAIRGGAIYNTGTLTMINNTLSANQASESGAALYNTGALHFSNNILANSLAGGDCFNSGSILTNVNNLVEDGSCSASLSGDPLLDMLGDYGGAAPTFALLPGSPAIDAGNDAACQHPEIAGNDQRGAQRLQGDHCDLGSYESSDQTPPDTSFTETPPAQASNASAAFSFTSNETLAVFECKLGSGFYRECASPVRLRNLAPGTHKFSVRAKDAAGNLDLSPAEYTWEVTLPETALASTPPATTTVRTASFTFSSPESLATFECRLNSAAFAPCVSPASYNDLALGRHTFAVRAVSQYGLADPTPAEYTWTVQAERLRNGGLNTYPNATSKVPSKWVAAKFGPKDGKNTTIKKEGTASIGLTGQAGISKSLKQTINLAGTAGEPLTFSFWVRGKSVPLAGTCQGNVSLYQNTTLVVSKSIKCPGATFGFTQKKISFNAPGNFNRVVIQFTYTKASGSIWFDGISLLK